MGAPDTLSQAMAHLQKEGYTKDFRLLTDTIELQENGKRYRVDEFEIVETYRFEGMNDPSDSAILYAIETEDGLKGVMTDSYGAQSAPVNREMIEKFQLPNSD